jgi:flagellar biosynthesis/type III secretory pathway M-ring protein FliF/YscJ
MFMMSVYARTSWLRTVSAAWNPTCAFCIVTIVCSRLTAGLSSCNSRAGDYKVLYANLSDKDGGAIIAQLSQMNVPYRHAEGGGAILVPADKVHDVRLKLASPACPRARRGLRADGQRPLRQTQFQERLTFQRGLEGELVRSITALAAVQAARVHLALPNQNGFFREQQKPTASVLLTLHPAARWTARRSPASCTWCRPACPS